MTPRLRLTSSLRNLLHLWFLQTGRLAVHHVVGNHCLAVGRPALLQRLGISEAVAYRTMPIAPGWRLIILDTTVRAE